MDLRPSEAAFFRGLGTHCSTDIHIWHWQAGEHERADAPVPPCDDDAAMGAPGQHALLAPAAPAALSGAQEQPTGPSDAAAAGAKGREGAWMIDFPCR